MSDSSKDHTVSLWNAKVKAKYACSKGDIDQGLSVLALLTFRGK